MVDLSDFPYVLCLCLSIEGCVLCVFHLFLKLLKHGLDQLKAFGCLFGSQGLYLGHVRMLGLFKLYNGKSIINCKMSE
jgi:hypothetical protein